MLDILQIIANRAPNLICAPMFDEIVAKVFTNYPIHGTRAEEQLRADTIHQIHALKTECLQPPGYRVVHILHYAWTN